MNKIFFDSLKENFELYGFADILESSLIIYNKACSDKKKIDFEDLLQVQCAIKNGCDVFITEDKGIHKSGYEIDIIGLDDVLSQEGDKLKNDYHVFISFKNTSEDKDRQIANKIYEHLKKHGLKVFFSDITLAKDGIDNWNNEIYNNAIEVSKVFISVGTKRASASGNSLKEAQENQEKIKEETKKHGYLIETNFSLQNSKLL